MLRSGKHDSRYLQHAWDFYGEDAFDFSVLLLCDESDLLKEEQKFLDASFPPYNTCKVAGAPPSFWQKLDFSIDRIDLESGEITTFFEETQKHEFLEGELIKFTMDELVMACDDELVLDGFGWKWSYPEHHHQFMKRVFQPVIGYHPNGKQYYIASAEGSEAMGFAPSWLRKFAQHKKNHRTYFGCFFEYKNQELRALQPARSVSSDTNPIVGFNPATGDVVRFKNIAESETKGFIATSVSNVLSGKHTHTKGYVFAKDIPGLDPTTLRPREIKRKSNESAVERINLMTGEKTVYFSVGDAAEKTGEDFDKIRQYVYAKQSQPTDFRWRLANGLTEKNEAAVAAKKVEKEKSKQPKRYNPPRDFEPAIGTPIPYETKEERDADQRVVLLIRTKEEAVGAGFEATRIREVCDNKFGRRSHKGYSWEYQDLQLREQSKKNGVPTQIEEQGKPVVGFNPETGEIKRYPSRNSTEKDGFDASAVLTSIQKPGKRKTGGFYWFFDKPELDPATFIGAVDRTPETRIVRICVESGIRRVFLSVADAVGKDGVTQHMIYASLESPDKKVCNGRFIFKRVGREEAAQITANQTSQVIAGEF
jgi:hypothetical protein